MARLNKIITTHNSSDCTKCKVNLLKLELKFNISCDCNALLILEKETISHTYCVFIALTVRLSVCCTDTFTSQYHHLSFQMFLTKIFFSFILIKFTSVRTSFRGVVASHMGSLLDGHDGCSI